MTVTVRQRNNGFVYSSTVQQTRNQRLFTKESTVPTNKDLQSHIVSPENTAEGNFSVSILVNKTMVITGRNFLQIIEDVNRMHLREFNQDLNPSMFAGLFFVLL